MSDRYLLQELKQACPFGNVMCFLNQGQAGFWVAKIEGQQMGLNGKKEKRGKKGMPLRFRVFQGFRAASVQENPMISGVPQWPALSDKTYLVTNEEA